MDKTTIKGVITQLKNSLITNGIDVDGIALFGSALNGNMRKDSDIDMIIISKAFEGKDVFERVNMTVKPEIEVRRKYNVPKEFGLEYDEASEANK